jgi:site-specific DNA recombinase
MANALGYSRLSDVGTIDTQNKQIVSFCDRNNLTLVKLFSDDGVSGGTFNRPEWKKLEAYLKKNPKQIQYIIVTNSDRFSRDDFIETMLKRRELQDKYNLKLLTTTDSLDLDISDPMTQLMQTIQAFTNEQERQKTIERQLNFQANKKSKGFYPHKAPLGYINKKMPDGESHLIIDETKVKGVRALFNRFAETGSVALAKEAAKAYNVIISGNSTIQRMINNPIYCGNIKVPATRFTKGEIKKGRHEPIISQELFDLCLMQQTGKNHVRHTIEEVPLRGSLRCWCGGKLTAGRSKGKSKYYWYYVCNTHKENLSAIKLHDQFEKILETLSFSDEEINYLKETITANLKNQNTEKDIAILKKQIAGVEQKIKNTEMRYLTNSEISEATYKEVMQGLKRERTFLNDELKTKTVKVEDYLQQLNNLLPKLKNFKYAWQQLTVDKRSSFVNIIFGGVLYYRNGIYRTPTPSSIIMAKALILKEKGLLEIEQPFVKLGEIPCVPQAGIEPAPPLLKTGF